MLNVNSLLVAALVSGVFLGGYTWHRTEVRAAVQAAVASVDLQYRVASDEQRKRLAARSEASTRLLNEVIQNQAKVKQNEVAVNKSKSSALVTRLRDNPKTPSASSGCNHPDTSASGSAEVPIDMRLFGFSGENLVRWFAEPAGELQAELRSCIADYEAVREQLNKFEVEE
jgi:uncharacterized membrane-anchored protein YhcB (DUF1043 family)